MELHTSDIPACYHSPGLISKVVTLPHQGSREAILHPSDEPQTRRLYRTTHKLGEDNVRFLGLDLHNPVFFIAALLILIFIVPALAMPAETGDIFLALHHWVNVRFDWLFIITANILLVMCLLLLVTPLGRVRIGGAQAQPDYSYASWFAMMFAAGIGIGYMFYGVLEPVTHTMAPPLGIDDPLMPHLGTVISIYHWGLHLWAIYSIVGLALALSIYNFGLPQSVRSAFYPLLGDRVWGWMGHVIDILAVFATLFGLATSLGLGAQQISAGLSYLFDLAPSIGVQILVVTVITVIALISVLRGMDKGIKRLSELNMVLAFLLLLFAIIMGPTLAIFASYGTNLVEYMMHLPALSNWINREDMDFLHNWTTFYWAWTIAWSPFVGMFLARISRGRRVREFIAVALLVPTIVAVLWFSTFGGVAATQMLAEGTTSVSQAVANNEIGLVLFKYLETLPFSELTSGLAIMLVIIFFVSSMDSGSLVVDTITAGGKTDAPIIQRVFWCIFEGLIALALLLGGGLVTLQAASLLTGVPFAIVLLLMCVCLYMGLRQELAKDAEPD